MASREGEGGDSALPADLRLRGLFQGCIHGGLVTRRYDPAPAACMNPFGHRAIFRAYKQNRAAGREYPLQFGWHHAAGPGRIKRCEMDVCRRQMGSQGGARNITTEFDR